MIELNAVKYELATLKEERELDKLRRSRELREFQKKIQEEVKAFEHERSEKNFLFERQKALAEELAGMREEAVKVRVGFPSSYSIHSRGVS